MSKIKTTVFLFFIFSSFTTSAAENNKPHINTFPGDFIVIAQNKEISPETAKKISMALQLLRWWWSGDNSYFIVSLCHYPTKERGGGCSPLTKN